MRPPRLPASLAFALPLALVFGPACAGRQPAPPPTTAAAPPKPVIDAAKTCPRCQRIFDGTTWNGWEHDPTNWSITPEGAMRGFGKGARSAFTQADYGSFRLIVTSRMAPVNKDHLGFLFWGPRPEAGTLAHKQSIQVQPPHGAMWDYFDNKNIEREKVNPGSRDFESWNTAEVLVDITKGTVRMAVDGTEITRYQDKDPARLVRGPIGMQKHGGGGSEYKDIFVEADPSEDRLLTVSSH